MSQEVLHQRIMIDDYFDIIVQNKASDLHMQEGQPPKMRLHGDIQKIRDEPLTHAEMNQMLSEVVGEKRWAKFLETGDVDCAYELSEDARFRCNLHKHLHGYGGIFRLIPNKIATLEQLNVPVVIKRFANIKGGLVLVTGPTGSGKSTTLASLIDVINASREEHIMTIEDPIEFLHKHKGCIVNQRELGSDATSFADALKAALRQDPDVILVGEMRDLETIGTAITAAETGHLVFATLHTQDTPQTIDRIIDVFPPTQQAQVRAQLAVALQGIMTQMLLPTADGSGRAVAAEIMVPTPAVRNLIREGKTHQIYSVLQTGGSHGMQTMDASLSQLVRAGKITRQLAESRAHSVEEFRRLVGSATGTQQMAA